QDLIRLTDLDGRAPLIRGQARTLFALLGQHQLEQRITRQLGPRLRRGLDPLYPPRRTPPTLAHAIVHYCQHYSSSALKRRTKPVHARWLFLANPHMTTPLPALTGRHSAITGHLLRLLMSYFGLAAIMAR